MIRRIVVVDTMGGLGDLVLALPMLHALAASHPGADLHVVTTAPWHVLLERDPAVREVVPVEGRTGDAVRAAVVPVLERVRPDLAVTTSRMHGLPELLEQYARHAVTNLWRQPPADELVDLRYCRLLAEDGWVDPAVVGPPRVVLGDDEVAAAQRVLAGLGGPGRPVLCFPDSGMAVKRWPATAWADLVRRLAGEGCTPIVVAEHAEQRDALLRAGAIAPPPLALRDLAALAAAVAVAGGAGVGGDTGPVRLAAASGLPCVGLYGATVPGRYGLREPQNRNLLGLPGCPVRVPTAITEQECWWSARCPLTPDHTPACMADIGPAEVAGALLAV